MMIALGVAMFFAMNIGASGTAAAMGEPYGGGAIRSRRAAVGLVAAFALLGAALGGQNVIYTVGKGIVSPAVLGLEEVLVILGSACVTLFVANVMGIPLSTSEVTVGAVVGVGLAYRSVYVGKLALILASWAILPAAAFGVTLVLGRHLVPWVESRLVKLPAGGRATRVLAAVLVISGCYEAFSAGMNNVANAVGPLVGAELIDPRLGAVLGGVFLGVGALTLGGNVLETNGKKIARLSVVSGSLVSLTSGTLVVAASLLGIPVPLTQATTTGILGIGYARSGRAVFRRDAVKNILRVWVASPVVSLAISYSLAASLMKGLIPVVPALGLLVAAGAAGAGWASRYSETEDRPG